MNFLQKSGREIPFVTKGAIVLITADINVYGNMEAL